METKEINNLVSLVFDLAINGNREKAIKAIESYDCPKEVKEHIVTIFATWKH
jgi:hypothetical protein